MPIRGIIPCLLYADNALFSMKPEIQQILVLKIVLLAFSCISGLKFVKV